MDEFEVEIDAALQAKDRTGRPRILEFWSTSYLKRLNEVHNDLRDDLTDSERRGAEKIGVVWEEQKNEAVNTYP